jgi:ribonuclease D
VQIAAKDCIACIDPLAIEDLDPLMHFLFDPARLKVLHSGRQDLEFFYDRDKTLPGPLFDTQIAAGLLAVGDQLGYGALVHRLLDVELAKEHTRTDWRKRPLSVGQLTYAGDDVRYLSDIYENLRDALEERGRLHWVEEECLALVDPANYSQDPENAWSRLKGVGRLSPSERNVARVIGAWREEQAIRLDKPRRWIMGDSLILDLARIDPEDPGCLDRVEGLKTPWLRRQQETFLRLVRIAHAAPQDTWPTSAGRRRLTREEEVAAKATLQTVRDLSETLKITSSMLATRRDVEDFVRDPESSRMSSGWRRDVLWERLHGDP